MFLFFSIPYYIGFITLDFFDIARSVNNPIIFFFLGMIYVPTVLYSGNLFVPQDFLIWSFIVVLMTLLVMNFEQNLITF